MQDIKSLLTSFDTEDKFKYVTREFQDYGYRIAAELGDLSHRALYIKLAKNEDRFLMESAFAFAKHYEKAQSKGKVFMWKLKELKKERSTGLKKLGKQIKLIQTDINQKENEK